MLGPFPAFDPDITVGKFVVLCSLAEDCTGAAFYMAKVSALDRAPAIDENDLICY